MWSRFPHKIIGRRAVALIYVLLIWTIVCGFACLGVDWARVQLVKTKLQNAADAAARAAAAQLPNGITATQNAAVTWAGMNTADNSPVVVDPNNDVEFGVWNPTNRTFTVLTGNARYGANSVRVHCNRTTANGNAPSLTFGSAFGMRTCDVNTVATGCTTGNTGSSSIIGLSSVTMSGSAYTDSYNATQGAYVAANAHHNGSISSNGNITLSNTAKVDGDARCGVGKTTTLNNTASVTGLNACLGAKITYPSVTLPGSYNDLGDVNMSSGNVSIGGGVYVLDSLVLSGTAHITWTGPVTLYIRNGYSVSGSALIDTYQNLPANRILNFLPTCTTATWSGTNTNVGEMYAPDTDFTISGSVSLFGRVTAKTITNSSSGGMHYDESLAPPGGTSQVASISIVK